MTDSKKVKVSTFEKTLTLDEAEREKRQNTPLGKSLKDADELDKRRRKGGVSR